MLAPIFTWELQRTMQRRWFHAARLVFAALLLVFFLWHLDILVTQFSAGNLLRLLPSMLGRTLTFYIYLALCYCFAIFVVMPILAVGPLLQEKKQKTLDLLLTTQQRSVDVVLGHWLAAVVKMMLLTTPAIPLLVWMHAFADMTPLWWLAAWIGCTWLVASTFAAWSLLVAVCMKQTISALLFAYVGQAILMIVVWLVFDLVQLQLWPHAVYDGSFWLHFALLVTLPTVSCLTAAIWLLRPLFGSAAERDARAAPFQFKGPIGDQPILWKQRYCGAFFLPRFLHWIRPWGRIALFGVVLAMLAGFSHSTAEMLFFECVLLLSAFPLAALIWACQTITSEREADTWDSLRLTSLTADEIVNDTLQVITSRLLLYWCALLPAIAVLIVKNYRDAYVFLLWLMGGIAIYHAAVAGLHASVRLKSSWGSMLQAISTFAMFSLLFGAVSLFGAGLITLLTCLCSCRLLTGPPEVGAMREHLEMIVFGFNVLLFSAIFLMFLHLFFRSRSTALLFFTVQHLASEDGFARAEPKDRTI